LKRLCTPPSSGKCGRTSQLVRGSNATSSGPDGTRGASPPPPPAVRVGGNASRGLNRCSAAGADQPTSPPSEKRPPSGPAAVLGSFFSGLCNVGRQMPKLAALPPPPPPPRLPSRPATDAGGGQRSGHCCRPLRRAGQVSALLGSTWAAYMCRDSYRGRPRRDLYALARRRRTTNWPG